MDEHARSIYGCTAAPAGFSVPKGALLTYNPDRGCLYLHLVEYPAVLPLKLDFADNVRYAQFLNDASEVRMENGALLLPTIPPCTEIPVVELYLK
jgi:alpha-L-fucosidase